MKNNIRLADYVAQKLAAEGCKTFFMLSGGMMMHLMDAFGRIPGVKYYCNHHEQASAMAADAYARESGKLGLCLATSGPGATNLLTGLAGAYQDSIPVLFITGQCKRRETVRGRGIKGLRQCGFLEIDIIPIVESVTKYAAFVDSPDTIRHHLEKAIHLASTGRPGPVLLDIPLDIQGALIDPDNLKGYTPDRPFSTKASEPDLMRVFDAVHKAKRPLILAGHGITCAGLAGEFRDMVERWQIPVATSLMAKDLLPDNHPLHVGHPGPRAQRGANFVVQSADVIVTMGCSLHIQTVGYEGELFAPKALKIQLDVDPALLEREHVGANWKFGWDLADYLPRLYTTIHEPWSGDGASRWRAVCQSWKSRFSSRNEKHDYGPPGSRVNLYEFVDILSDELSENATILTDAGQPHPILAQALRLKAGQRYLNPGSFAEMGYALPAALGAAAAAPQKTIVSVFGDGSLQTNIHELQTLVHNQFNVKIFVINNDGYASIRNTQKTFFKGFYVGSTPDSGVTLPNTGKICSAYGLPFVNCQDRDNLRETIRHVLERPGPVLCEVMAVVDQKILPVVVSKLLADGSMRSNALHQMFPDIEVEFEQLTRELD